MQKSLLLPSLSGKTDEMQTLYAPRFTGSHPSAAHHFVTLHTSSDPRSAPIDRVRVSRHRVFLHDTFIQDFMRIELQRKITHNALHSLFYSFVTTFQRCIGARCTVHQNLAREALTTAVMIAHDAFFMAIAGESVCCPLLPTSLSILR